MRANKWSRLETCPYVNRAGQSELRWLFGPTQRGEYLVPECSQLAGGELVGLVRHQVEVLHAGRLRLLDPLGAVLRRSDQAHGVA